ncbi:hypothetical protein BCU25_018900 [Vibrio cyclitrophicus]|nr:hypothetical protein [Vibrio cyclitrophicus]PMJ32763.1 hypothetical protein BCU25_12755 [Vibrio cyclitrophicus]
MNLQFLRDEYNDYTASASNINRQMSLAGIAIVWILVEKNTQQAVATDALWFFVAALSADLLQAIFGSLFWSITNFRKERELKNRYGKDNAKEIEEEDFEVSSLGNVLTWSMFCLKITFVLLGYWQLLQMLSIEVSAQY